MGEWTLQEELDRRGMTLADACKVCRMDGPTMGVLVDGGVTLPQLALKVGEGLRLTVEQTKRLGQQLHGEDWGKDGLPKPDPIDTDTKWWRRIKWKPLT